MQKNKSTMVMQWQRLRRALILVSFLLFPVTIYYFSPVLVIQGLAEGIIAGSFVVFGLQLVGSVVLGRAFCGWICPAGGLQEMCTAAVDKPAKGGKGNWVKFLIWTPWVMSIAILFLSGKGREVDLLYQTNHGLSVAEPYAYIVYYGVIGLVVIMSFVAGRRAFCHYVCWMAPFMIIGTKIGKLLRLRSLRLVAEPDKCVNCGKCTQNCAMSLPVSEMVRRDDLENSECILCGTCVDSCQQGVLKYGFRGVKPCLTTKLNRSK